MPHTPEPVDSDSAEPVDSDSGARDGGHAAEAALASDSVADLGAEQRESEADSDLWAEDRQSCAGFEYAFSSTCSDETEVGPLSAYIRNGILPGESRLFCSSEWRSSGVRAGRCGACARTPAHRQPPAPS